MKEGNAYQSQANITMIGEGREECRYICTHIYIYIVIICIYVYMHVYRRDFWRPLFFSHREMFKALYYGYPLSAERACLRHPVSGRASGGFQRKARINMHEDHLYGCHPGPLALLPSPYGLLTIVLRRSTLLTFYRYLTFDRPQYTRAIPSYLIAQAIRLYNIPDCSVLKLKYLRMWWGPIRAI